MTRLLATFAALLALLGLTVAVSFLELGAGSLVANLAIAAAKAGLIAAFFMHLAGASAFVRIAAAAGVVWLGLLFGLGASDYARRDVSRTVPLEERLAPAPGPAAGAGREERRR